MKRILLFAAILAHHILGTAQPLSCGNLNTVNYPLISLEITSGSKLNRDSCQIRENDSTILSFDLIPSEAENSGAAGLCFLIDASPALNNRQFAQVKRSIKKALEAMPAGTMANIAYFHGSRSVQMIKTISLEFTADYSALFNSFDNSVFLSRDKQPKSDIYKAVYECIEYVSRKKDLSGPRKVIIISTGLNNGSSSFTSANCLQLAKDQGISLDAIGIISPFPNALDNLRILAAQQGGTFTLGKAESDIYSGIQESIRKASTGEHNYAPYTYTITYTSEHEHGEDSVSITVTANGETASAYYTRPGSQQEPLPFLARHYRLILGAGVILLALIIYLFTRKKSSNKPAKPVEKKYPTASGPNVNLTTSEPVVTQKNAAEPEVRSSPRQEHTVIAGNRSHHLMFTINGHKTSFEIEKPVSFIGRGPTNDLILSEASVSGIHAKLTMQYGKVIIEDQKSSNGTFVNNQQITGAVELLPNDNIRIGRIILTYQVQ